MLRFAHFSVQEFLLQRYGAEKGHAGVAAVCLTLLMATSATGINECDESSLVRYASFNWPEHVRLSGAGNRAIEDLTEIFLNPSPVYQAWVSTVSTKHDELRSNPSETLAPLLVACHFRLSTIFGRLLHSQHKGADLNYAGKFGYTVLHLAARQGNDDMVFLLLGKKELDLDRKDKDGRTPLSWAAEEGHEKVVQMLLEKEKVDVNSKDTEAGRTALSWAARNGHEKAVEILLEKEGVDVNSKDEDGRTPLSWAAENGYEKVVQVQLAKEEVDVNSKDKDGRTPLSWAAQKIHGKVVQMLLAREGIDVNNKSTKDGTTPLYWAARNWDKKMMQMLREKGAVEDV